MSEAPNLDCLSIDPADYVAFCVKHLLGLNSHELFPDIPKEARDAATSKLAEYARHKGAAMRYRLRGRIALAMANEEICEAIYRELPEFARW